VTPIDLDRDLESIQEARQAAEHARQAFVAFSHASQELVDRVCAAMAEAAEQAAAQLGRMASEETGYGVAEHKALKNRHAARNVWESIRDLPTVGVIRRDESRKVVDIAWPVGVVAALSPSTNPTSTVIFKTLIAVKARNAVVHAPHPAAARCCAEAARLMAEAAEAQGAPPDLVQCLKVVTLEGTQALMRHKHTAVILATGGAAMVEAAHSVGKPAYGVGPGNVPAYVDRSADIALAARYIVASKAFDYSVICATEQAAVVDRPIAAELRQRMQAEGALFVDAAQADALRRTLFHPDGSINTRTVGQSPQALAQMAGFAVPDTARILVAELSRVGRDEPLSREKLTTVLGWYEVDGWQAGCDRCMELISFGGRGHSQVVHARDEEVILAFGLEKPVFRIVVNTMGTLGTIGLTTGVMPSMTLGSGGVGGAITGDNITVHHLYDVKRLAYERTPPPAEALAPGGSRQAAGMVPDRSRLESMVQEILNELRLPAPPVGGMSR
jgi:acetaldehyde dehydrogenase (acetylating)